MTKTTRLNLRISDSFRQEIEALADYHGLTMSSYAHSLLIKAIRREREETPEAFAKPHLAPVVATIAPAINSKDEVRKMFEQGTPLATSSKRKIPMKVEDDNITQAKRKTR